MENTKIKIDFNSKKIDTIVTQKALTDTIDTYENKINLLEKEIEKLKAKQWKYKIGAWVL